ncbi:hypothetical protein RRG08_031835 [Elysia crispata]|uniref:Uncharacterized protein n=1 Tax=Elysia crispata TaxID=231223 RepID=A0AAE0Y646_9GAST|nr:hypothetical protein RRG08_031835 [Elysia crispata]
MVLGSRSNRGEAIRLFNEFVGSTFSLYPRCVSANSRPGSAGRSGYHSYSSKPYIKLLHPEKVNMVLLSHPHLSSTYVTNSNLSPCRSWHLQPAVQSVKRLASPPLNGCSQVLTIYNSGEMTILRRRTSRETRSPSSRGDYAPWLSALNDQMSRQRGWVYVISGRLCSMAERPERSNVQAERLGVRHLGETLLHG